VEEPRGDFPHDRLDNAAGVLRHPINDDSKDFLAVRLGDKFEQLGFVLLVCRFTDSGLDKEIGDALEPLATRGERAGLLPDMFLLAGLIVGAPILALMLLAFDL
jgi:hypothetical protein